MKDLGNRKYEIKEMRRYEMLCCFVVVVVMMRRKKVI
jgi:hypothetical protein